MKPFAALNLRSRINQVASWAGHITASFSSGDFILRFNNDGTVDLPNGASSKWLNYTPDPDTAALYEIQWTGAAGVLTETTALTQNVWYPLNLGRSFTISGTQGLSDKSSSFTIAIRLASSGGAGTSAVWQHTITGSG